MVQLENLPKSVPNSSFEFSVEVEGSISKQKYSGNFRFKIPNFKSRSLMERERDALNKGLDDKEDETLKDFNAMYSYLKHNLTDSPDWWRAANDGYDLYDFNVLIAVYLKAINLEGEWLEQIWGKPGEPEPEK